MMMHTKISLDRFLSSAADFRFVNETGILMFDADFPRTYGNTELFHMERSIIIFVRVDKLYISAEDIFMRADDVKASAEKLAREIVCEKVAEVDHIPLVR